MHFFSPERSFDLTPQRSQGLFLCSQLSDSWMFALIPRLSLFRTGLQKLNVSGHHGFIQPIMPIGARYPNIYLTI